MIQIGSLKIDSFVALAPMAGVADRAFRELCVEHGAGYTVTELISAKGVSRGDKGSHELLLLGEKEHPCAIQLFGDEPDTMADAAVKALRYNPEVIDINMGCPAPKVSGHGSGSALMKTPDLAFEIVKQVVQAVDVPVTAKIRAGWDENSINAPEIAILCEKAGAAAVAVHGRTKKQMYSPPVNLDVIKAVREAVSIPVIGNGDICTAEDAKKMLDYTRCDMVMVGRGAMGNPWIFDIINAFLRDGTVLPPPSLEEKMATMLAHIEKLCQYKGEFIGMREARKHTAWYMKGLHGAAEYRRQASYLSTFDDIKTLVGRVIIENGEK